MMSLVCEEKYSARTKLRERQSESTTVTNAMTIISAHAHHVAPPISYLALTTWSMQASSVRYSSKPAISQADLHSNTCIEQEIMP